MEYKKVLVQVEEVLKQLSRNDIKKIPLDILEKINKNKDKKYVWKYDEKKELEEQNLDREALAILSFLNMTYLLNEEERNLLNKIHRFNSKNNK